MKNHTHLTKEQRYQISGLLRGGYNKAEIAREMNVDKSTISRETRRNLGKGDYYPIQADKMAVARRSRCKNALRITGENWQTVEACVRERISPEQISARLAVSTVAVIEISHETIYQYIYRNKRSGGDLVSFLRGQKRYRKRYGSGHERRGAIKNRVSIDERPGIVEEKIRMGDYEGDTVIGKNHQGVLVTLVDRCSRFTFARVLPNKSAKGVTSAIKSMLRPHKEQCHTLTFDNGKEFAGHEKIAKYLGVDTYFAHPYCSWERGVNENTNGLLRQYFPKSMSLRNVTQQEVQEAVDQLNHRPRKCLGYKTPYEAFFNKPSSWDNPLISVAFQI